MSDNNKLELENGFMPYYPPDISVDNSKWISYDADGFITQISNADIEERKKPDYSWVKKPLIIILAVCLVFEGFSQFITFTPGKWKHEFWRPIIAGSLLQKSTPDETSELEQLTEYESMVESQSGRKEIERLYFEGFIKSKPKNSLLYCSPEEVRELLGEPNPNSLKEPDMAEYGYPDKINLKASGGSIIDSPFVIESYYAYIKKGKIYWISVVYLDDYAIKIIMTNS